MEVKKIKIPIYDQELLVIVGDGEDYIDYMLTKYAYDIAGVVRGANATCSHLNNPATGASLVMVWFPKEASVSTIVHELIHASWYLLDMVGISINADNHEAQTYLVGYLLETVTKKFKL